MTHIYAKAGDEIRDAGGRLIATVARDLSVYQTSLPSVGSFTWSGPSPSPGDPIPPDLYEWLAVRRAKTIEALPERVVAFKRWQVV